MGKIFLTLSLFILMVAFTLRDSSAQVKFIKNHGQWKGDFEFKADVNGGSFFSEKTGFTYLLWDHEVLGNFHHRVEPVDSLPLHSIKVEFEGANPDPEIMAFGNYSEKYNYFLGNDPNSWVSGLSANQTVNYFNIYEGIRLEITGSGSNIKYNFHVSPNADPDQIKLKIRGAESLQLEDGMLKIKTSVGEILEDAPVAYQILEGKHKTEVKVRFSLKDNVLSFRLPRGYDKDYPLVIDPEVVFSTYSGSNADNFGFTGTYDLKGNGYSGGTVYQPGFPTTAGAFQRAFAGGDDVNFLVGDIERDIGILKYSPDGTQLLYATYIGGSHNEQPHSMVVNSRNQLVVFGTTGSFNFPVTGGYDMSFNFYEDIYALILSSDGTSLKASTYIGGSGVDGLNGEYRGKSSGDYFNTSPLGYNYGDNYRGEVIVDSNDNIFISSCTRSKNFPATPGSAQSNFGGGDQDAVVISLSDDLSTLKWATFLGGSEDDAAYGITLDQFNNVYVVGGTESSDFPATSGVINENHNEGVDAFISRISSNGSTLLQSTFFGTNQYDQGYFIQTDLNGDIFITGQTEGIIARKGVNIYDENSGQFIIKTDPFLSEIIFSTVFGTGKGFPDISPSAFLVDICGNVYVSGWGGRTNQNSRGKPTSTRNLFTSPNAFQRTTDGSDFYLIVFQKNIDSVLYATFFGGHISHEHVDGGTSRFDKNGKVYQSVCGGCGGHSDFPTKPDDVHSPTNNSDNCNNAFFKIDLDVANQAPIFKDRIISITATDTANVAVLVKDPNRDDPLSFTYKGDIFNPSKTPSPTAKFRGATEGKGRILSSIYWPTSCAHISVDTYFVDFEVWDDGCLKPKSTTGKIGIIVNPPPVSQPPGVFCSSNENDSTLRLAWTNSDQDKYFKEMILIRRNPDNSLTRLDSFTSTDSGFFKDYVSRQNPGKEYCFYLINKNICDLYGPPSYEICTGPDHDMIPAAPYVFTATVNNNENIKVVWNKSREGDFRRYDIFYKPRSETNFVKVKKTYDPSDTIYIDDKSDFNRGSYCYKLIAHDVCGFQSDTSNVGCTIFLQGKSFPFEHYLYWTNYKNWRYGVKDYTLKRRDPLFDLIPVPVVRVNHPVLETWDRNLNLDVGAYYYTVTGEENSGKLSPNEPVTSISNEVYLFQSPIIYLPNVFTVNGDNINDSWDFSDAFVKDFNLKIFNRWGEKVLETSDKNYNWNGWIKNPNDPDEKFDNVFIYLMTYTGWDGSVHFKKGNITLLK